MTGRGLLGVSVCFLFSASLALYAFFAEQSYAYVLVLLLFGLVLTPFVVAFMKDSFDLFESIYAFGFLYFLEFGARTLYLLNGPQGEVVDFFFVPEALERALLYAVMGFGAMLLGYYSKLPDMAAGRLPALDFNPEDGRTMRTIIWLYAVGMLSRAFFFAIGRTLDAPAVANLVDYLFFLCQWALILAFIYYFQRKRGAWAFSLLWFVFLPVEVFFTFLRPGRHFFLPVLLAPFMTYHYLRKKVSAPMLIVPAAVMLFIITPVIPPIKALTFQGLSPKFETFSSDVGRIYDNITASLDDVTFSEYLEQTFNAVMNRVHGIDSLTTVISYTPEAIDYQYGKTIFAVVGFLVPKVIRENTFLSFLDTDIISLGRRFGGIYYSGAGEIAGVEVTQLGELYLNFHVFGILAGMFLLGVFYRAFYLCFKGNPHPFSLFIYVALWFWIVIPSFWFVHAYSNFLKQLLLLLAVCWFLNGGRLFKEANK